MKKQYLFTPDKIRYIKGERPGVECILCAIINGDEAVKSLEIYRTQHFLVSVNLYPYNLGHLIIFPLRHIEDITPFSTEEIIELHNLQIVCMQVIKKLYNAVSFNIGYNIGEASGASIKHLHLHVVPRYLKEAGFLDILNGCRLIVEDPLETVRKLKSAFEDIINNKEV